MINNSSFLSEENRPASTFHAMSTIKANTSAAVGHAGLQLLCHKNLVVLFASLRINLVNFIFKVFKQFHHICDRHWQLYYNEEALVTLNKKQKWNRMSVCSKQSQVTSILRLLNKGGWGWGAFILLIFQILFPALVTISIFLAYLLYPRLYCVASEAYRLINFVKDGESRLIW